MPKRKKYKYNLTPRLQLGFKIEPLV